MRPDLYYVRIILYLYSHVPAYVLYVVKVSVFNCYDSLAIVFTIYRL